MLPHRWSEILFFSTPATCTSSPPSLTIIMPFPNFLAPFKRENFPSGCYYLPPPCRHHENINFTYLPSFPPHHLAQSNTMEQHSYSYSRMTAITIKNIGFRMESQGLLPHFSISVLGRLAFALFFAFLLHYFYEFL